MSFLLSSLYLLCANFSAAFKGLAPKLPLAKRLPPLLHLLTAQSFALAFGFTVITLGRDLRWLVLGIFTIGAGSVVLFGRKIWPVLVKRDIRKLNGSALLSAGAVLAGAYLMLSSIDHWVFWSSPKSGLVDTSALSIDGIQCSRPLLVNFEGDKADWRCPGDVAIGGMQGGKIYAPWLSYSTGSSPELKRFVLDTMSQAAPMGTAHGR